MLHLPVTPTRGSVTRFEAATMAAATFPELPRKNSTMRSSSTTESPSVKQVCVDRPISTISSSTAAAAVAPARSLTLTPSLADHLVSVHPSHHPLVATYTSSSTNIQLRSVPIPTTTSAYVAFERLSPAHAPLSSTPPSTTFADQVDLIDIAASRQFSSPTVPTRDAVDSVAAASHASVSALLIFNLKIWSWPPRCEQRLNDDYVDGSSEIGSVLTDALVRIQGYNITYGFFVHAHLNTAGETLPPFLSLNMLVI